MIGIVNTKNKKKACAIPAVLNKTAPSGNGTCSTPLIKKNTIEINIPEAHITYKKY
tara:strand:- start:611 stop:778 length:168 start_codon:yes stop_codon:yes gene_type:complete